MWAVLIRIVTFFYNSNTLNEGNQMRELLLPTQF